jgi:hypothetical protein
MVKTWVYEKGVSLYEEGKVEYKFTDGHGKASFVVWDSDEDIPPRVSITDSLEFQCGCGFGVLSGDKRCPHEIAVDWFIVLKGIKGNFGLEILKKDGRAGEVQKTRAKKELSSSQKKVLRDILSCEVCGKDENIQLHRISRQSKYLLRNIQPSCKKCHRELHSKEKGHYHR